MPFLDKTGLAHFWNQVIARLNTKVEREELTEELNELEASLNTAISGKADVEHSHDDRYYTESEIDSKVSAMNTAISGKADASHSHSIDNVENLQTNLDLKMNTSDPVGTGSFSMNRKADTEVGEYSSVLGINCTASGSRAHAEGNRTTASGNGSHAEGLSTTASGSNSHAEGQSTTASGSNSHAEGGDSHAEGVRSHAEGSSTTASADYSHAEGFSTTASGNGSHAEGNDTTASGNYSHAEGFSTQAKGSFSHAEGYHTIANFIQHASGKYNVEKDGPADYNAQDTTSADAVFIIGCGTSSAAKNGFRVSSSGKCFGSSTFGAAGADFAELFEWADGNPNNEDRRGLFVTLDEEKIRVANAGDDYIGVISGAQAFIGNSASEEWHDKYLADVFGTKLSQTVEVPAEINEETGEVIRPATTATQYVLNPDYNPDEEYVMRENRKEWGIVGLLGQIVMIDDGTCVVGGRVAPSINGVGTASNDGYRVMKRIDENHIKVLVK